MRKLKFGKSLFVFGAVNVIVLLSVLQLKAIVTDAPIEEVSFGFDGLIAVFLFFILYRPIHVKYFGSFLTN